MRVTTVRKRSLCNSGLVAEWRHVQALHEQGELRNPDTAVRTLLPALTRWRCAWLGERKLADLRADPFYYYLVARTKYYDHLLVDAITNGTQRVVNVGCGSDTRSKRFADLLVRHGVEVLECDRPEDIARKQQIARQWASRDHIAYASIDLNDSSWPALGRWLSTNTSGPTFVFMEGVSPYIDLETFGQFLRFLAVELPRGSRVAYDFKFRGVADHFGGVRGQKRFRLPAATEEVARYHARLGYTLDHLEQSDRLQARFLSHPVDPLFVEDGLIQLLAPGPSG